MNKRFHLACTENTSSKLKSATCVLTTPNDGKVYAAVPIKNSSMNGFRGTRRISMYLLTKWKGQTGKYLARGHDVPTKRSEVRVS